MSTLFAKPKVKQPPPMPREDDPEILAAKRDRILKRLQEGGRASTILSGDTSFQNETLGVK